MSGDMLQIVPLQQNNLVRSYKSKHAKQPDRWPFKNKILHIQFANLQYRAFEVGFII